MDAKNLWVASLNEAMPLTPPDFTAPQGYILVILAFPFVSEPRASQYQEALSHIKSRLARTFSKWPCLGGQFIAGGDTGNGWHTPPKLVYSSSGHTGLDLFPDEVFDSQVLNADGFGWTFAQLQEQHGPAVAMDKDTLLNLPPTNPGPGEGCHPVTLRATFIDGGILLGFGLHHGIMDGGAVIDFLSCFSGVDTPNAAADADSFEKLIKQMANFHTLTSSCVVEAPVDTASMTDYDFDESHEAPADPAPGTAKILPLSASVVDRIRRDVLEYVKNTYGSEAFVSTSDVICALTWVFVTRARAARGGVAIDEVSRFATAVDIRSKILPSLPSGGQSYFGNMFLRVLAFAKVSELIGPIPTSDGTGSTSTSNGTPYIALAALRIREAITSLSSPTHLRKHLAIAALNRNHTLVDIAVRRAINRGVSGVDASMWVGLGADLNFRIPGTGGSGKPTFVRRAYSPFSGAVNVMPRVGGTKGDKDWEVLLALRTEDMDFLLRREELGGLLVSKPL